MKLKLKIESIPNFTWGISLANKLPREEWDELRQRVYRDANYECEICGATNKTLHCHEVWAYDYTRGIQKLIRLECCCEICHDVHHFGRTSVTKPSAYVERCIGHWCRVNKKTRKDFNMYLKEVFEINKKKANIDFVVKVGRRILT